MRIQSPLSTCVTRLKRARALFIYFHIILRLKLYQRSAIGVSKVKICSIECIGYSTRRIRLTMIFSFSIVKCEVDDRDPATVVVVV
jgi:hypothetical protein